MFVLPDLEQCLTLLLANVPAGKVTTPRALAAALGNAASATEENLLAAWRVFFLAERLGERATAFDLWMHRLRGRCFVSASRRFYRLLCLARRSAVAAQFLALRVFCE